VNEQDPEWDAIMASIYDAAARERQRYLSWLRHGNPVTPRIASSDLEWNVDMTAMDCAASTAHALTRDHLRRKCTQPLPVRLVATGAAFVTLAVARASLYQLLGEHQQAGAVSVVNIEAMQVSWLATYPEQCDDGSVSPFNLFLRGEPAASAMGSVSSINYGVGMPGSHRTSAAPSTISSAGAVNPEMFMLNSGGSISALTWRPYSGGTATAM
jgi:hypothetical protein